MIDPGTASGEQLAVHRHTLVLGDVAGGKVLGYLWGTGRE